MTYTLRSGPQGGRKRPHLPGGPPPLPAPPLPLHRAIAGESGAWGGGAPGLEAAAPGGAWARARACACARARACVGAVPSTPCARRMSGSAGPGPRTRWRKVEAAVSDLMRRPRNPNLGP